MISKKILNVCSSFLNFSLLKTKEPKIKYIDSEVFQLKQITEIISLKRSSNFFIFLTMSPKILDETVFGLSLHYNILIKDCLKTNETSSTCDKCANNSALTGGKRRCVPPIDNCEVYYDDSGKCNKCKNNLSATIKGEKCVPSINNCLNYDDIIERCIKCSSIYILLLFYLTIIHCVI